MPQDIQQLIRRTKVLIEVSEALCGGSNRTIERSKRLLESVAATRSVQLKVQRIPLSRDEKAEHPS